MQTLTEKAAAIRSLLPLIFAHRDFIAGGTQVHRATWVSEPSPLDPPPPPPPLWNLACDGHCDNCRLVERITKKRTSCPPEEKWLRTYRGLRSRYRIRDLEVAIMCLADHDVIRAQAVWAVYVEPWPGERLDPKKPALGMRTEPIAAETRQRRAELAESGVWWLASEIEGDVVGEGDNRPTKEQQCADLVADGIVSPSVIAQRLGVSTRHAKRLKAAVMVRCQSAPSAVG